MAKEGRGGLGLGDRLILFAAWVVTCGMVYVLGFYVGKGTQERRFGMEERIVRLPVTSKPPAEGQRPKEDDQLSFYEALAGDRDGGRGLAAPRAAVPAGPKVAAAPPPSPATSPAPGPGTVPSAAAARPAIATTPAAPPAARPASPTPPAATSAARPAPASPSAPAPRPVGTPVPAEAPGSRPAVASAPAERSTAPSPAASPARDEPPAPPRPAPAPPPATAAAPPPRSLPPSAAPSGRGWTVQANPSRSRDDAEALQRRLRERGYEAVVVRVLRDGDTWYRVQVGRFATSEQASETMQRLREREGVTHAFVATE
jgi:hypothetical protein